MNLDAMNFQRFLLISFISFLCFKTQAQELNLQPIQAGICPVDMTNLRNGEACFFEQDWGIYARGVRRKGCILRVVFPQSERAIDYFIGKWQYDYNEESNFRKINGHTQEVGYYQHDTQVGEWLTYDVSGNLKAREFIQPTKGIPVYDCIPIK